MGVVMMAISAPGSKLTSRIRRGISEIKEAVIRWALSLGGWLELVGQNVPVASVPSQILNGFGPYQHNFSTSDLRRLQ